MMNLSRAAHLRRYGVAWPLFNALLLAVLLLVPVAGAALAQADGAAADRPLTIVTLGDSLTAGYGLPREAAFTSRLEAVLREKGYNVSVPNTGVSGETTAGGLARLDWLLGDRPDLVIVALGANDGLRGMDPAATRDNLDRILARLTERQVPTVLAGMLAPRNLGRTYGEQFDSIYPALADRYGLPFYPFFLDGVALQPDLNLDDGMHPNAQGVEVIVQSILPTITGALDALGATPTGRAATQPGAAGPGRAG